MNYSDLAKQAICWGDTVLQEGWIGKHKHQLLKDCEAGLVNSLFANKDSRPLIVAFFGGTGVGKSSLINRLAGKEIARASVERPTSREVMLYYHREVVLRQLPENLPLNKIKTVQHDDATQKNIFWIDMPDMDSIEPNNKQLVLDCLPHIDVLVYTVSPERYRDNKAWCLLLAEDSKHAWLFVLNHWDRGSAEQYEDFTKQLAKAGFANPIIIKTICNEQYNGEQKDDFKQLKVALKKLTNRYAIGEIANQGDQARTNDLKLKLESCLQAMGKTQSHQQLKADWHNNWEQARESISKGMAWSIKVKSAKYAEKETRLLDKLFHKKTKDPEQKIESTLWDDWAQSQYLDALNTIILDAHNYQLAIAPIQQTLEPLRTLACKKIEGQAELHLREALVNRGNKSQRLLLKFFGLCVTALPLMAMIWVAYQLSNGFYASDIHSQAYLGADFAIHSILLIGIAWLLPFFAIRQFKPSLQQVALKGLAQGVEIGLATLGAEVIEAIDDNQKIRDKHVNSANVLIKHCAISASKTDNIDNATLARMLISKH